LTLKSKEKTPFFVDLIL